MSKALKFALAVALAGASGPLRAEQFGTSGPWQVYLLKRGCGMYMMFEGKGNSEAMVLARTDGGVSFQLVNGEWTTTVGETYNLDYSVNGKSYTGTTVGAESDGVSGYFSLLDAKFLYDFAAGSNITVRKDHVVVDDLPLVGSGAAIAMLKQCVVKKKANDAAEVR